MNREDRINQYFQKKNYLTPTNPSYRKHITNLFSWMTHADDIVNDKTAKFLNIKGNGVASITSKQDGIIAGIEEVCFLLKQQTKLQVFPKVTDGTWVTTDTVLVDVAGSNNDLLAYERSILNILGRMSGIASC